MKLNYSTQQINNALEDYELYSQPGGPTILRRPMSKLRTPTYISSKERGAEIPFSRSIESKADHRLQEIREKSLNFDHIRQLAKEATNFLINFSSLLLLKEDISDRAFWSSVSLLLYAQLGLINIPTPCLTPVDEGGIDIEWEKGDLLITIHIRKDADRGDRIFVQEGSVYGSEELTPGTFTKYIAKIL